MIDSRNKAEKGTIVKLLCIKRLTEISVSRRYIKK